jgi:hypothetical protein
MITARVSHVSAYARWKAQEDTDVDWIINDILSDKPSEAMLKGTAFHKFLEHAQAGESDRAEVDGYSFVFAGDFDLYLPRMREWRKGKDYGGIIVSGQVDAIEHKTIYDHKTTEWFDAENYLESWQHRFYLDIFEADRFIWNVWEMKHLGESIDPNDFDPAGQDSHNQAHSLECYEVRALHKLEQFRYPSLSSDCEELALEYRDFARKFMPQLEVAA